MRFKYRQFEKINISSALFILALIMFIFTSVLDYSVFGFSESGVPTQFNYITKMIRYAAYLLCVVKVFYESFYRRKGIVLLMISIGIVLLSYLGSSNQTMILSTLLFVAVIGVDSDHVIKTAFWTKLILVSVIVIGSQIGLITDYVSQDERLRHFLGFSWTTTGAILALFIMFEYIYIRRGEISLIESTLMIGICYYFYRMTDARFAFAVGLATVLFFLLFKKLVAKGYVIKRLSSIMVLMPQIIGVFAFWLHSSYDPRNPIMYKLNDLLSDRLQLGKQAIAQYGVSLFGQPIKWIGHNMSGKLKGKYNYVDCSYVQIMLEYGLLLLLLGLIIYSVIIYFSIKTRRYYLTWLVLIILLFSISEPRLFNLTYNSFMLLSVSFVSCYQNNDKKGRKLYE